MYFWVKVCLYVNVLIKGYLLLNLIEIILKHFWEASLFFMFKENNLSRLLYFNEELTENVMIMMMIFDMYDDTNDGDDGYHEMR